MTLVEYVKSSAPVIIQHTIERGYEEYAICVAEEPEYWINAFATLKRAEDYCKRLNLPIVETESDE